MRARTLHTDGEQRTVAIVLSTGDEAMACLKAFAEREHVTAAQFTAIGAFAGATLGYFDWTTKEYRRNAVDEQVEVASLTGDIALGPDGNPALHIHCVLGRRDGAALAGELNVAALKAGIVVVHLAERERSLEDAYFALTGSHSGDVEAVGALGEIQ